MHVHDAYRQEISIVEPFRKTDLNGHQSYASEFFFSSYFASVFVWELLYHRVVGNYLGIVKICAKTPFPLAASLCTIGTNGEKDS